MEFRRPSRIIVLLVLLVNVGALPAGSVLSAPVAQDDGGDADRPALVEDPRLRHDDPAPAGLGGPAGRSAVPSGSQEGATAAEAAPSDRKHPKLDSHLAAAVEAAQQADDVAGARVVRARAPVDEQVARDDGADGAASSEPDDGTVEVVVESATPARLTGRTRR